MLAKYEVAHFGQGDFKALTLPRALEKESKILREHGRAKKFYIRNYGLHKSPKDDFWGPERSYDEVLDISRDRQKMAEVGYRHIMGVADIDPNGSFRVKPIVKANKVDVAPNILDITGSPKIDIIYTYNVKNFRPTISNLGTWYCRYVDGTFSVSKHGYKGVIQHQDTQEEWFGAAIDFGPSGDMDFLRTVWNYNIDNSTGTDAIFHNTGLILFEDLAWTPERGVHTSGAMYHYHVHIETTEGTPCSP